MSGRGIAAVMLAAWLGAEAAPAFAQSAWQPALDLYAAASYDEALAALDALDREALDGEGVVAVEQHRMLCLMALGRSNEAEGAAEALLTARPSFAFAAQEASPRVRALVDTTRRRVLPALARAHYAEARRAYDAGDHLRARDGFAGVAALLRERPSSRDDTSLDDLRTLTDGFLRLSEAALEREAAAAAPAAAEDMMAPLDTTPLALHAPVAAAIAPATVLDLEPEAAADVAPTPALAGAASAAPTATAVTVVATAPSPSAPFTPLDIFTYDWRDKDVVPPVPVAQPISGWWGSMGEPTPGTRLGVVDLVVNEHGRVIEAAIYQSVNRVYDAVLLASVKQWRYEPATRGGRPVKYRRVTGVVSGR